MTDLYTNNPLHSLKLEALLTELVEHYGWEILAAAININCFKTNPTIKGSLKFLRKTDWAREKLEGFYLYRYKHLPRPDDKQFALPPRDRIVPDDQSPGEPVVLTLEGLAEIQRKKDAAAANKPRPGHKPGGQGPRTDRSGSGSKGSRHEGSGSKPWERSSRSASSSHDSNPWGKAKRTESNEADANPWGKAKRSESNDADANPWGKAKRTESNVADASARTRTTPTESSDDSNPWGKAKRRESNDADANPWGKAKKEASHSDPSSDDSGQS
ncbi:VF530 family DNA-binding protein [Reinekea sp.]|jgi:uncharacterized protein (DUF2132 family)|uniref:VF530 family protein n=1 Tax=Reinekea sp. TaxID=1970455 RepID=UPI002A81BD6D|nr:VF530 family DNA-binding protein [Reinekea sp.]